MKPLLYLEWRACHWPVAEQGGQHLFCGEPLPADTSEKCFYCAKHEAKARIPTRVCTESDNTRMVYILSHGDYTTRERDSDKVVDLVDVMGEG